MLAAKAPVVWWTSGALLLAACAGAPPGEAPRSHEAPAQTIYVLLAAPPPDEEEDAWIPEDPVSPNPFVRFRTWSGDYDCPQGRTDLTLRVLGVQGPLVRAVFNFRHLGSGTSGSYLMAGAYDGTTRNMTFAPGAWLERPDGYVTVGMTGDVSEDASLFAGRIDHEACGAFRLRPAR